MLIESLLKILIVDSNELDRETYSRSLANVSACTILEATSSDALQVCRSQSIDAILLHISQFTLIEEIRSTLGASCPAVIVIAEQRDEAIAEDILIKDQITPETLWKTIENADLKRKLAQTQQKLQESERFNQYLTEAFPGILYILDLVECRSVYVSRQVIDLLGFTPEEIQEMDGDVLIKLIHPDDYDRVMWYIFRRC
ncbi:MAG TPA: hypothetical protein VL134_04790 [Leptolyngbya sp.]|jgi:CheY-like chemotaxis protein|nr:hypothetical protein [Leptolyngbya sp.]